jgi:type I restriction enzyme, S subunit
VKAGWETKRLGEIIQLEYGKPLADSDRNPNGLYPAYGANGIKDRTDKFYKGEPSIIVGRKGSAGEVTLTEEKYWPLDVTFFVEFDRAKYELQYLYFLLLTLNLPSMAKGVKPGINRNDVYDITVATPDIEEQRRIVTLLDEAFADIATAKANAEKNLQNARELCEGLMQALFPDDENVAADSPSLDSLCELIVDCEHKTAPTQETGIPSIRTPNIGKGRLILEGVYRVSDETYAEWTRRGEPQGGDLILAREAPAGNVAVIPDGTKVCLGQRTVLIRPKKSVFEPAYLAQLLLRQNSQRRLLAHSRGATVQHINMKDIRAFKIGTIPSLADQQRIVNQVNELFDTEDRLVSIYRQKLTALDDLKKTLLHQAFSGQL